ncbi:sensor histidine kinase [Prosthecomicrobium sp. N25]|uniref:sensor histidine kinase n=1 Tax=Prosthecomicrobium sp. N25 TaxID=3129254 RepID=UPI0030768A95
MATDADGHARRLTQAELEELIAGIDGLAGILDPVVVATRAAEKARALSGVDVVGLAAPGSDRTVAMLGNAGAISEWFARLRVDIDFGQGFMGTIMSLRLPLLFEPHAAPEAIYAFNPESGRRADLVLGGRYAAHLANRVEPEQLEEYIGLPIELNGGLVGLLLAGNRVAKPDPAHSRVLLARFARMVAPALAAARQARERAATEIAAERERIAVDLHDTIGQILFGIGASAKRSASRAEQIAPELAGTLRAIEAEASRAGAHLREILRTIGQPQKDLELETELRILAGMFSARSGIPSDVVVSGARRALPPDVFGTLVAVAREALHNVEKHAEARTVVLTLHFDPERTSVVVQDDGIGLPGASRAAASKGWTGAGMGLSSLRRRLDRLGGRLTTRRLQGGGTVVSATLDTRSRA